MLGDSDKTWRMVRIGIDRAHTVNACRETSCDRLSYDTINSRCVKSLEKCENIGVLRCGRGKGADVLDRNVRVTNDVASPVDLLGCRIVVGISVDEVAGFEVVDRQLDVESGVGGNVLTIHRRHKFSRRHVRSRGNDTHRSWIARTSLDLLAIRDGHIGKSQGTEIDEVVARRE
jgi:hypothetical protein